MANIPGINEAKYIYGIRHFRYPIDVVNHENKVGVPDDARMTCMHCKNFAHPSHIVEHHGNRSRQGTLFE